MEDKPALLRALAGETMARPPVWLMRQAGRYLPEYRALREKAGGFLELCLTPELAAEATLQPIRRFGFDAAILFADLPLLPLLAGFDLRYAEGEGPVLTPGKGRSDVTVQVAATVQRVKAALPPGTALIGFTGAPWTVAAYCLEGRGSRDFATAKTVMFREPARYQALVDRLTEVAIEYLVAQAEAGADALKLFDSWAGVLPETSFRQHVIEATRRLVEGVKARTKVPVIGFPRGAGFLYHDYARHSGVDALALDPAVPLAEAAKLQAVLPVQGNLDPIALVAGGSAMAQEVSRIRAKLGRGPFVFNLGHGIVPQTPPEHVATLVALLRGDA